MGQAPFLYGNKKAEEIIGYKREEFIGNSFLELNILPAKYLAKASGLLALNAIGRPTGPDEFELIRKDNSHIWVEISTAPIKQGGKTVVICFVRDITDRKQSEEALRQSEEKYATLVEKGNDGIIIIQDGVLMFVNSKMLEMAGFLLNETLGRPFLDFVSPESRELVAGRYTRRMAGQSVSDRYEIEILSRDGEKIPVEINANIIEYEGKPADMAIIRDISERRKAEEALKLQQAYFQQLFENSPDAIVLVDNTDRVVQFNKGFETLFGYRAEEVKGRIINELIIPEDRIEEASALSRTALNGKVVRKETVRKRKDGSLVDVFAVGYPIRFGDKLVGVYVIYSDITVRKRAEETLAIKTTLLEAAAETTLDGILAVDDKDRILLSNKRFQEMWHIPQELIDAKDNWPVLRHAVSQVIGDPERAVQEVYHLYGPEIRYNRVESRLKDGRVYDTYSSPLLDRNGGYRGRIWYFQDITESKQAQARIERAAEEWRTTFDSITDFVSIHDKDNRIVRVNKALADVFKTTPKELIGEVCHEVMHGTTEPPENCPHRQTLRTGKPATMEMFEPTLGVWIQDSTSPIFNDKGEVTGSVHIVRDVSEWKRMEEQLVMTDRLASIGELASGIAHELNNPLTSVIGFSQLLMEGNVPDHIKEDLGTVYSEARRAAAIVKNLLTFARKHAPVKQLSQVNTIIEDVLRLRAYEQRVNNIEVEKRLAADLPEIMVDYFQMQQVFLNIIVNAEFAMLEAHGKGKLVITTETVDGVIKVAFADDGPGISKENMKRIFAPFFTTKEVGKGTGLGLSICHGIVSGHSGRIYAESELGQGATFVVELPLNGN
jgi:PAS domain S-box-containing protein